MTALEIAGTVAGIGTPLGGLIVFAIRSFTAPLKVVIENNTAAMVRLMAITDQHGATLGSHAERLACIDERHKIEDRSEDRG
jgi:hypothetical protein